MTNTNNAPQFNVSWKVPTTLMDESLGVETAPIKDDELQALVRAFGAGFQQATVSRPDATHILIENLASPPAAVKKIFEGRSDEVTVAVPAEAAGKPKKPDDEEPYHLAGEDDKAPATAATTSFTAGNPHKVPPAKKPVTADAPAADADAPRTAEALVATFKQKAKTLGFPEPKAIVVPAAEQGNPAKILLLVAKNIAKFDTLRQMGFNDPEQQVSYLDVESWKIPPEGMKKIDPSGVEDLDTLKRKIRAFKTTPGKHHGFEMVQVTGDWTNGFTLSGVAGANAQKAPKHYFGLDSVNKETIERAIVLIVKENVLREAMTAKPDIEVSGMDDGLSAALAAAVVAEKGATGFQNPDDLAAVEAGRATVAQPPQTPPPTSQRGGFLKRLLGGGATKDGRAQGGGAART